jgi:hypothetical protein
VITNKPKLIREFANYGLGIYDYYISNAYLADKDADYNAVYQVYKTQDRMWGIFSSYYLLLSIGYILALGEHWLEGVKYVGVSTLFLISRFLWAASQGPPKFLKVPAVLFFIGGLGVAYTFNVIQKLLFKD